MPYVLSRLAAGVEYEIYNLKTANGIPQVTETIYVKGGADVADSRTLVTMRGVSTEITKEQSSKLKAHPVFKIHQENGVVEILDKLPDPEKAAENLDADASRQIKPEDYAAAGKDAPTTGATEK